MSTRLEVAGSIVRGLHAMWYPLPTSPVYDAALRWAMRAHHRHNPMIRSDARTPLRLMGSVVRGHHSMWHPFSASPVQYKNYSECGQVDLNYSLKEEKCPRQLVKETRLRNRVEVASGHSRIQ